MNRSLIEDFCYDCKGSLANMTARMNSPLDRHLRKCNYLLYHDQQIVASMPETNQSQYRYLASWGTGLQSYLKVVANTCWLVESIVTLKNSYECIIRLINCVLADLHSAINIFHSVILPCPEFQEWASGHHPHNMVYLLMEETSPPRRAWGTVRRRNKFESKIFEYSSYGQILIL